MLKDEDLDRCIEEVIPLQQSIDQYFHQAGFRDFECALLIETLAGLGSAKVASSEIKGLLVEGRYRSVKIVFG